MLTASLICLALAAVGGVVLALQHTGSETPPMPLALGHGLLAAAGLVLLIVATATTSVGASGLAKGSVAAFVVAALGGFYLFSRRFSSEGASLGVILVHGAVAVIGFLMLLVVYL